MFVRQVDTWRERGVALVSFLSHYVEDANWKPEGLQ